MMLLAGVAYAWLVPLTDNRQQLKVQLQQQARELQTLRRQVSMLPDRQPAIAALNAQLTLKPFSPLALNPGPNGHLIRWQPEGDKGELELALTWNNVPAIFAALAESDMLANGFALSTEEAQTLRLTLQLERPHEK
nr:hypothetical protein [Cronobacter condimenti]